MDSVTSMIQNARNIVITFTETARSAHTCSIPMDAAPITWNPKMPGKKPLVLKDHDQNENQNRRRIIRRETNKYERSENQLKSFIEM